MILEGRLKLSNVLYVPRLNCDLRGRSLEWVNEEKALVHWS